MEETIDVSMCDAYLGRGFSLTFLAVGVLGGVGAAIAAWFLPWVVEAPRCLVAEAEAAVR